MKMVFVYVVAIISIVSAYNVDANPVRTSSVSDICSTRTSTVRHVSQKTKAKVYKDAGIPGGNHTGICSGPRGCEVDHRIALGMGGSNSMDNLMIQPYDGPCSATHKDKLENRLHRMICAGEIQPAAAQELIYNHWIDGYRTYVDPGGCE